MAASTEEILVTLGAAVITGVGPLLIYSWLINQYRRNPLCMGITHTRIQPQNGSAQRHMLLSMEPTTDKNVKGTLRLSLVPTGKRGTGIPYTVVLPTAFDTEDMRVLPVSLAVNMSAQYLCNGAYIEVQITVGPRQYYYCSKKPVYPADLYEGMSPIPLKKRRVSRGTC